MGWWFIPLFPGFLYNWLVVEFQPMNEKYANVKIGSFLQGSGWKKNLWNHQPVIYSIISRVWKNIYIPDGARFLSSTGILSRNSPRSFWNNLFLFTLNSVLWSHHRFFCGDLPPATPQKMPENSIGTRSLVGNQWFWNGCSDEGLKVHKPCQYSWQAKSCHRNHPKYLQVKSINYVAAYFPRSFPKSRVSSQDWHQLNVNAWD